MGTLGYLESLVKPVSFGWSLPPTETQVYSTIIVVIQIIMITVNFPQAYAKVHFTRKPYFPYNISFNIRTMYSDVTVTNRVYRKVSDIYSQIYATVNEIT